MKKALLATVLGISLSAAWAVDWDSDDDFVMLADNGTVIGQGELDDDGLELELLSGYRGFMRFDAGGEMVEGIVNADGTITLYNANGFVELDDDLSSKGYSLVVTPVDSIAAPAGIVVTPTDPNRDDDDDMDDDGTSGVPGSDDDDDGNDDNSSDTGGSDDDDMNGDDDTDDNGSDDGSSGGDDDADDNSSSSGGTDTSSDDDNDSSGSNDTSSDDDGGDDDGDDD